MKLPKASSSTCADLSDCCTTSTLPSKAQPRSHYDVGHGATASSWCQAGLSVMFLSNGHRSVALSLLLCTDQLISGQSPSGFEALGQLVPLLAAGRGKGSLVGSRRPLEAQGPTQPHWLHQIKATSVHCDMLANNSYRYIWNVSSLVKLIPPASCIYWYFGIG